MNDEPDPQADTSARPESPSPLPNERDLAELAAKLDEIDRRLADLDDTRGA